MLYVRILSFQTVNREIITRLVSVIRGSSFYADLAYQYSTYKEDFYAFDNVDLPATKITNSNSQVLMTLGVRF